MTEPQPVMAQAEQDQLTRQVGRALLAVAGDGWQRVRAEYRSAGRHIEADVFVTGPDGVEHPVRPPQEVVEGFGRLRQGMYRPGRGTWLSAAYLLEPPSSFSAEFEPDVEPEWRRVPPPIGFQDELKFFPRADENLPDWLRQRAGLPPVAAATPPSGTPAQSTPPQGTPAQNTPPAPANDPAPAPWGNTPPPGVPANPPFRGAPTPPPFPNAPAPSTPPWGGGPNPGNPAPRNQASLGTSPSGPATNGHAFGAQPPAGANDWFGGPQR